MINIQTEAKAFACNDLANSELKKLGFGDSIDHPNGCASKEKVEDGIKFESKASGVKLSLLVNPITGKQTEYLIKIQQKDLFTGDEIFKQMGLDSSCKVTQLFLGKNWGGEIELTFEKCKLVSDWQKNDDPAKKDLPIFKGLDSRDQSIIVRNCQSNIFVPARTTPGDGHANESKNVN